MQIVNTYFSDFFQVDHTVVEEYGALDISLVCDNPAFVDPFLIFANSEYSKLHNFIIEYLKFLRQLSQDNPSRELDSGDFKHYYKFPEVKQVWLGYSASGNEGAGLSITFANSLYGNLNKIFSKFGDEKLTKSSHLEKLCLVEDGIGIDKISDFTLNLIKEYLLEYTSEFATRYIDKKYLRKFAIEKTTFDFTKKIWTSGTYLLPHIFINGKAEFILLVPKNILTKEETWISRNDFLKNDTTIINTIQNDELRAKINRYFLDQLLVKITERGTVKDFSKKSKNTALIKTMRQYPIIIDQYLKYKEDREEDVFEQNNINLKNLDLYIDVTTIKQILYQKKFGKLSAIDDCIERISFFKQTLESNSKSLYLNDKTLNEKQLQLMFKNATYGSLFDYNSEVNNGRGPIDFIVSIGSEEKVGIEFKLASNTKLRKNLLNQSSVYQEDSHLKHVIKVIFYFSDREYATIGKVLGDINKRIDNYEIFTIDCRKKESASNQ